MDINECTGHILDCSMKVHSRLGPGLLEGAYEACLGHELRTRGFEVQSQVQFPIEYEGIKIELGYRVDLVVEHRVIVELKAVAKLLPVHEAQLLSYLKLSGFSVGLLLNFHELHMRDGVVRMVR